MDVALPAEGAGPKGIEIETGARASALTSGQNDRSGSGCSMKD